MNFSGLPEVETPLLLLLHLVLVLYQLLPGPVPTLDQVAAITEAQHRRKQAAMAGCRRRELGVRQRTINHGSGKRGFRFVSLSITCVIENGGTSLSRTGTSNFSRRPIPGRPAKSLAQRFHYQVTLQMVFHKAGVLVPAWVRSQAS